MIFDPFENRLCRNIRNDIGYGFVKSVQQRSLAPFNSALKKYHNNADNPPFKSYINHRLTLVKKILMQIDSGRLKTVNEFSILMFVWSHQLYYEFHEWVEELWLPANGNYKKSLQGLIFASVALEHHQYNRQIPAQKLSIKAIAKLERHGLLLPELINTEVIVDALKKI